MSKRIKNINGAGDRACQCGSWLAHWQRLSGRRAAICAEVNCEAAACAGALVMKDDGGDNWFVIPLCREHNALTGQELEVVDAATMVSAETGAACGART